MDDATGVAAREGVGAGNVTRQRARRGEGERLREEILDAAEHLLVEKGSIEAVSLRGLARAVGVTPPSLYLHFADKDELFFEVCSRRFEEFNDHLQSAAAGIDDPANALMAMGRAYIAFGIERPEAYRVLFGVQAESVVPDDVEPGDLPGMQAFDLLVQTIEDGIRSGVFRAEDPIAAAIGIWATMHGLVMLLGGKAAHDHLEVPGDIVELVCQQALDGLRAR